MANDLVNDLVNDQCGDQLRHETIKRFRADPSFRQTRDGTYFFTPGHVYYAPLMSTQMLTTVFGNSASHIEILRRTMGEEKFAQILRAADPKAAYDAANRAFVRQEESRTVVLDADEIKAEIEKQYDSAPLSAELETAVLTMLRQMGRLASPMAAWARPKADAKVFQQLRKNLIEGEIESRVKPGLFIYKAVEVTVLLNGPKTFIISAGERGIPDSTHDLIRQALELIVPRARIRSAVAGYIVVQPNLYSSGGHLEFLGKDKAMTVLSRESY